jgi:hypothetical protein
MMPLSTYLSTYHYRRISTKDKSNIVHVRKVGVPSRPKPSPLITSPERKLLSLLEGDIFQDPIKDASDKEAFLSAIEKAPGGLVDLEHLIVANYSKRTRYLQAFGSLTTKRLQEFRLSLNLGQSRRKADFRPEDVNSAILKRKDPVGKLAQELLSLKDALDLSRLWTSIASEERYRTPSSNAEWLSLIRVGIVSNIDHNSEPYKTPLEEISKKSTPVVTAETPTIIAKPVTVGAFNKENLEEEFDLVETIDKATDEELDWSQFCFEVDMRKASFKKSLEECHSNNRSIVKQYTKLLTNQEAHLLLLILEVIRICYKCYSDTEFFGTLNEINSGLKQCPSKDKIQTLIRFLEDAIKNKRFPGTHRGLLPISERI